MSRRMYALKDFCETGAGSTPPRAHAADYYGGHIPWVKSGELRDVLLTSTEEFVTEAGARAARLRMVPKGSLLVAMYGATVGRTALLDIDATTNQAVCYVRPDPQHAEVRYLWHALKAKLPELLERRVGGAQPNISQETIRSTMIHLPPLAEQRRIADMLDKADAIRRKRKEAIALTEELLRSAFLDMFGDPVTNPKRLKMEPLGEYCDMETGYPFESVRFQSQGIRLCRGANVLPGVIDWSDLRHWPSELTVPDRYHLRSGDIVLAMDRPWISSGLKLAIVSETDLPAYLVQRVARLRATRGITNEFVYFILGHPAFARHCAAHMTETTVPHISPHDIRSYLIPIPKTEQLRRFAAVFAKLADFKKASELHERLAIDLFGGLSQYAFRGDLKGLNASTRMQLSLFEGGDR